MTTEQENLYYHGTCQRFSPGDLVDPSYELGGRRGRSYAYMTTSPEVALTYGEHKAWSHRVLGEDASPRAYVVAPTGPVERDDTVDGRFFAWRSHRPLLVVREITSP